MTKKEQTFYGTNGQTNKETINKVCKASIWVFQTRKLAHLGYDILWRSEFYKNSKDRSQDINLKELIFKVNDTYKKDGKSTKFDLIRIKTMKKT